jgi:hypothetical protein
MLDLARDRRQARASPDDTPRSHFDSLRSQGGKPFRQPVVCPADARGQPRFKAKARQCSANGDIQSDSVGRQTPSREHRSYWYRTWVSNPTPSANLSARNILRPLATAQKYSINTGVRTQTSALRRTGRDPKFCLPDGFSPKLPTARIQYGTR